MAFGVPNCVRFGQSALTVFAGDSLPAQRRLWTLAKIAKTWPHVRESVVGAGNLTLIYERRHISFEWLEAALHSAWDHAADDPVQTHTIEIPVRYGGEDGPDLEDVAAACGLDARAVAQLHAAASYVVAFIGFAPGFGYLDGLDSRLRLPRRERPRTHVPAGSVAIAGAQSCVYPLESPGGWHLIGRTQLQMFDPSRDPFALLAPGDTVRFVAI